MGNKINITQYDEKGRLVAPTVVKNEPKTAQVLTESDFVKRQRTHYEAKHQKPHPRQHSKTLTRNAVTKPRFTPPTNQLIMKSQGALYHDQINSNSSIVKKETLDQQKLIHANQVARHKLVDRFKEIDKPYQPDDAKVRYVPVNQAPKTIDNVVTPEEPVKKYPNPFDTAVERADSHLQPPVSIQRKRSKKRNKKGGLIVLIIAIMVGVYIYAPAINFEYVSLKADFQAVLPKWVPPSYKMENYIVYASQTVGLTYASYGNIFAVYEQHSDVGSQALLTSFLNQNFGAYQMVTSNGITVYIDSSGDATWLNGNIWFRIANYSNLSNGQIINIAAHL